MKSLQEEIKRSPQVYYTYEEILMIYNTCTWYVTYGKTPPPPSRTLPGIIATVTGQHHEDFQHRNRNIALESSYFPTCTI